MIHNKREGNVVVAVVTHQCVLCTLWPYTMSNMLLSKGQFPRAHYNYCTNRMNTKQPVQDRGLQSVVFFLCRCVVALCFCLCALSRSRPTRRSITPRLFAFFVYVWVLCMLATRECCAVARDGVEGLERFTLPAGVNWSVHVYSLHA